jgi:hypothetical protein
VYDITASLLIKPAGATGYSEIHSDTVRVTVVSMYLEEPDGLPVSMIDVYDSYFRYEAPWCFEWQFVHVDNEVLPYHPFQMIMGVVLVPGPIWEPFHPCKWEVSQGSLTTPTEPETRFIPDLPSVPGSVETVGLTLKTDPPIEGFVEERTLEVYRDHLERDYQNFGTGISCDDG